MSFRTLDKSLIQTAALSNGAGATQITGYDLGHTPTNGGRFLADMEFLIEMPVLTTTELPNSETFKVSVEEATDAAFTSPVIRHVDILQQLGAGGAGAAAKSVRWRPPTDILRFVRFKATKTGTGNVSGKTISVTPSF